MFDEQDHWLGQASKNVKKSAFYMRKAIEDDNMEDALRHSAALLGELRTSLLSPQKYYELYMQANDELQMLLEYFSKEHSKGRSFASLYELVQHAGNVVPRLYLLCSVGACAIRSKEAPAKYLLRDMADMCKGVQHPTRGLFLRAYLVQSCRGLLPDSGTPYTSEEGGNVEDAIDFLLSNFTEMNKLWVRMKYQPTRFSNSASQKDRIPAAAAAVATDGGGTAVSGQESERIQLADLVGKTLTRISQLEGLTFELYRDQVLPRVLEQVVACKDELAQGYLMQCIAAAFPDEFHVGTLEALLDILPSLQPGVRLATVMGSLLDRLASYASNDSSVISTLDSTQAFHKMSKAAEASVAEHANMSSSDLAALYAGLLSFAAIVYPSRLDYVEEVLKSATQALHPRGLLLDAKAERQLVSLLCAPLDQYDPLAILALEHFLPAMSVLRPFRRREISRHVINSVIKLDRATRSVSETKILFDLCQPLVALSDDGQEDEIVEDASRIARLVHTIRNDNNEEVLNMFKYVLKSVMSGGERTMQAVIPVLCFLGLKETKKLLMQQQEKEYGQHEHSITVPMRDQLKESKIIREWYDFMFQAAMKLPESNASYAPMTIQLLLMLAASASQDANSLDMALECTEQVFFLFEECISDSKEEVRALHCIMGVLNRCLVFDDDSRSKLVRKTVASCSQLLRRSDQCLAALACAHMYWQENGNDIEHTTKFTKPSASADVDVENWRQNEEDVERPACVEVDHSKQKDVMQNEPVQDPMQVLACLKRALRIAHSARQYCNAGIAHVRRGDTPSSPGLLFIDIANAYLDWYSKDLPGIDIDDVQNALDLAGNEVNSDLCRNDNEIACFWKNTKSRVECLIQYEQQEVKYSANAMDKFAKLEL